MHRRRRLALPAALVALTVLMPVGVPQTAAQEADPTGPAVTRSPAAGPTGTEIALDGQGCLVPASGEPGDGVVVRLRDGSHILAFVTIPVAADGSWSGVLVVPAGTPAGNHQLDARCAAIGHQDRDPVTYTRVGFRVTGEGSGAEANPNTPRFNGGIEDYTRYDGQSTCSPSTKPGMARFMNMVMRNYGGGNSGVGRGCGVGGTSEHKEGRAWDWRMNAGSAGDRARVNALMNWLFATDVRCNHYARARRLGVMYIIWNRRMFRLYDVDRGWANYSGSSPHTDHVHFSLSRRGGAGTTSFWRTTFQPPAGWGPGQHGNQDLSMNDEWDAIEPLAGDFDGNEVDDLLWYRPGPASDMVWYGNGDGRFARRNITVNGNFEPIVGDFNGDCRDDVYWYGSGPAPDAEWLGRSNRTFRSVDANMNGAHEHPVVGDFNRDRSNDILWYSPGAAPDALWLGSTFGFVRRNINIGGNYQPLAGDFDGDEHDDVLWFRPGALGDRIWFGKNQGFTSRAIDVDQTGEPIVGDYNDDQRADIFWHGPAEANDAVWVGRSTRDFRGYGATMDRPYANAVAGDFDGQDGDDLYWHASALHPDRLWRY